MFETLDKQIEVTEGASPATGKRFSHLAIIAIVAVAIFGGLLSLVFALE
jgi:hypothetical protein